MDDDGLIRVKTLSGDDSKSSAGFGLPANTFKPVFLSIFGGVGLYVILNLLFPSFGMLINGGISAAPAVILITFLKLFVSGREPNYAMDWLQNIRMGKYYPPKNIKYGLRRAY